MRRNPDNQLALVKQVERTLGPAIRSIGVEEEVWSASGALHLTGVWRATATPVHIKVGVNTNQLYWTHQIALADPACAVALCLRRAAGRNRGRLDGDGTC